MWSTFLMGHYVPLSWMTLGLDYVVWGMNPTGYHLTSLVLHSGCAVLVFFLARRLLIRGNAALAEEPRLLAASAGAAALLFAVHPLRVESVAWVTERRDVLSMCFYLASILMYLRALASAGRAPYGIAVGLFVCALLSKATAMTLPAVLLIVNVYPLRRLGGEHGWRGGAARRVYAEIAPFAVLSAAAAILSIVALHPPNQLTPAAKLAVSAYGLGFYRREDDLSHGPVAAIRDAATRECRRAGLSSERRGGCGGDGARLVAGRASALARGAHGVDRFRRHHAADAWRRAERSADRGRPVHAIRRACAGDSRCRGARPRSPVVAPRRRHRDRRDDCRLRHAHVAADGGLARSGVALVARARGAAQVVDRARRHREPAHERRQACRVVAHYTQGLAIDPNYAEGRNNLGVALARQGRLDEAKQQYTRAIEIKPHYDEPHGNLGVVLSEQGDFAGAIDQFRQALAENPEYADAQVNWGNTLVRLGKPNEALEHYAEAVEDRPDDAEAHVNWGVALAREGEYAEAVDHFRAALAINPQHADAKADLDQALRLMRQTPDRSPPLSASGASATRP